MADDDLMAKIRAWERQQADRPFGDTDRVSGQTLQPYSFGLQRGARNLLDKAVRALHAGEPERAAHLVDRALTLPYDDHEESVPAAMMAGQLLYDMLSDAVEESDADEDLWLDAALTVLEGAPVDERPDWAHAMVEVAGAYQLPREEDRRLRAAARPSPVRIELRDIPPEEKDELSKRVLGAVHRASAYLDALEEG